MEIVTKLVNFARYCMTCEYRDKESYEDPCHECLSTPVREHSQKPLNYKEKANSQKKQRI